MRKHYDDAGRLHHVEVYAYELHHSARGVVAHSDGTMSIELAPGRLTPLVVHPNPIPQPGAGRRLFGVYPHVAAAYDDGHAYVPAAGAAYRAAFPGDGAHLYR